MKISRKLLLKQLTMPVPVLLFGLVLGLASISGQVFAAFVPWDPALAERTDFVFGNIAVRTTNIFATDTPEEGRWIHRPVPVYRMRERAPTSMNSWLLAAIPV